MNASLPWVLRRFWIRSVAAFVMMLLLTYLEARAGNPGERFGPLVDPPFGDLLEYIPTLRLLHSAAFFSDPTVPRVAYPPLAAVLLALLYRTGHPVLVFLTLSVLWLGTGIAVVSRKLVASGVSQSAAFLFPLTLVAVSFPIAGLLQRGNIELFAWILSATGCWSYQRSRNNEAALAWGLAAALKLYPILFLTLLLSRREYRAVLLGLSSLAVTSMAAMFFLGPTLSTAWEGSLHDVLSYQTMRVSQWTPHDLSTNHSFFILLKAAAVLEGRTADTFTEPYVLCGPLLFAILYVTRLRRLPEPNQILTVSVFVVASPPTSYFYTLIELYPALIVLALLAIRVHRNGASVAGLSTAIQFFVPLFASFTLFTFRRIGLFAGPIQALFLLTLLAWAAIFPFAEAHASAEPTDRLASK